MLDPYTELNLPNDDASWIKTEAARRNVQKLAEHMWALQKIQNDIDFVLRNQEWFDSPDIPQLNTTNRMITSELNTIVEKADICATDFDQCQAYSPAYPEFSMPPRKAALSVPNLIGLSIPGASAELMQRALVGNPQPITKTATMLNSLEAQGRWLRDTVHAQDPAGGTPANPGASVQYSYYVPITGSGGPIRRLGRRR